MFLEQKMNVKEKMNEYESYWEMLPPELQDYIQD